MVIEGDEIWFFYKKENFFEKIFFSQNTEKILSISLEKKNHVKNSWFNFFSEINLSLYFHDKKKI